MATKKKEPFIEYKKAPKTPEGLAPLSPSVVVRPNVLGSFLKPLAPLGKAAGTVAKTFSTAVTAPPQVKQPKQGGGAPIEPIPPKTAEVSAPAVSPGAELPPYFDMTPEEYIAGDVTKQQEKEEELFGEALSPSTLEQQIQEIAAEGQRKIEFEKKQTAEKKLLEEQELAEKQKQTTAAMAGSEAAFAPNQEGMISAGAPLIVNEYKATLQGRIDRYKKELTMGQERRDELLRQMEVAQKQNKIELVQNLRNKIKSAEDYLNKQQTAYIDAQERLMVATLNLSESGLKKQESIRQNYETFTNIIESGGTFTPQGIVGLSKRLEIPFEDAWNFYEGAQSIRDDKKLTAQEKQVALKEKAFELDQKINGIQTEKAKNLNRYQKMKNMGIFTDLELQDIARGLDLNLAGLPENQAKLALDQANAEIKVIEAKYAGKPPPFGTKDYWDIEEKKAQIKKNQAELEETTQTDSVLLSIPKDLRSSVTAKANQFDAEPQVKNFQVVQEGLNFVKNIASDTTNPADDIGFIYAFAKIMDPNSVVREGEYATVQKYAQSWASSFGFKAARIFTNTKFLSQDAIENMRTTLQTKLKASEQSYDQIRNQYIKSINNLAGKSVGDSILQDYKIPKSQKSPLDTLTEGLKQYPVETQKKAVEAIRSGQMTLDEALEFYNIPFNQVGGDTEEASQEITQASIGSRKVSGQPKLISALERANQDMIAAGLGGLKVNESFRENTRQAQLYANYIEKPYSYGGKTYQPDPKRKGFRAAKPGQSFHGKGLAVDIRNWKEAEPFLRKYGLRNDLKDDKNHFSIGEFTG